MNSVQLLEKRNRFYKRGKDDLSSGGADIVRAFSLVSDFLTKHFGGFFRVFITFFWSFVFISTLLRGNLFSEDIEVKLNSADGTTKFAVQDSGAANVATIDSDGNAVVTTVSNGTIKIDSSDLERASGTDQQVNIYGAQDSNTGGGLEVYGKTHATAAGAVKLIYDGTGSNTGYIEFLKNNGPGDWTTRLKLFSSGGLNLGGGSDPGPGSLNTSYGIKGSTAIFTRADIVNLYLSGKSTFSESVTSTSSMTVTGTDGINLGTFVAGQGTVKITRDVADGFWQTEANPRWRLDRDIGGGGYPGIGFGPGGATAIDTKIWRADAYVLATTAHTIEKDVDSSYLRLAGGTDYATSGAMELFGPTADPNPGRLRLLVAPGFGGFDIMTGGDWTQLLAVSTTGVVSIKSISSVSPIASPADGMIYYNSATDKLRLYNGAWVDIAIGSSVGDVTGPGSATDNAVTRFDGTGGKTIQNSGVLIDDSNNISGIGNISASGSITLGSATLTGSLRISDTTMYIRAGTDENHGIVQVPLPVDGPKIFGWEGVSFRKMNGPADIGHINATGFYPGAQATRYISDDATNLTLYGPVKITNGNLLLNGGYLSNDGGSEGVSVDNSGNVSVSGNLTVTGSNRAKYAP